MGISSDCSVKNMYSTKSWIRPSRMAPQPPRMKKPATPSRMYSLTLIFSLTVVLARTPRLTAPQYSLYSFMVMERLSYREFS